MDVMRKIVFIVFLPIVLILDIIYLYIRITSTLMLGLFKGWFQADVKPFLILIFITLLLYRYMRGRRSSCCSNSRLPLLGIFYGVLLLLTFFYIPRLWNDIVLMPIFTSMGLILLDYALVRDGLPLVERVLLEPSLVVLFNNFYELTAYAVGEVDRGTWFIMLLFVFLLLLYFIDYVRRVRHRKLLYTSIILLVFSNIVISIHWVPPSVVVSYLVAGLCRLSPYLLAFSLEHSVDGLGSLFV